MHAMLADALLAMLHYLAIFMVIVFLACEAVLCKPDYINAATVKRLGLYDRLYFGAAMAALATGAMRLTWGVKGAAFYMGSAFFWAKMAVFVLIALLSIPPTIAFIRWRKQLAGGVLPSADEVLRVRKWVLREAHAVILLPVFAALMARGFGH